MSSFVIKKEHISTYLKRLGNTFDVWVPIKKDGITLFSSYNENQEPEFTSHARVSAKSFFLPQREVLLRYAADADCNPPDQTVPQVNRAVFGVKPCDARAIELNTRLLASDKDDSTPQDVHFKSRVEHTILIGYGCEHPGAACFCQATGGDPFGQEGLDALITDIGNELLFTLLPDRPNSQMLVESDLMVEATGNALAAAQGVCEAARETLASLPQLVKPVAETSALFELPIWEETAERCLNCGICTYLCPTCTCFDMIDEVADGCGNHFRCWDSCMFSLFTQHASGHNPRPGRKERLRQRFMHKLSYFPDRHDGDVSCVGCGRCVIYCPVNIDIREISGLMA